MSSKYTDYDYLTKKRKHKGILSDKPNKKENKQNFNQNKHIVSKFNKAETQSKSIIPPKINFIKDENNKLYYSTFDINPSTKNKEKAVMTYSNTSSEIKTFLENFHCFSNNTYCIKNNSTSILLTENSSSLCNKEKIQLPNDIFTFLEKNIESRKIENLDIKSNNSDIFSIN